MIYPPHDPEDETNGPKDPDEQDGEDAVDDADEGADEPDGVEDADGDEGDEGGQEDLGGSQEGQAEEPEGRVRKGASEVIRENKRRAQEATRKAEEATRRAEAAERRAEEAERRASARRQEETAAERAARRELMTDAERHAADIAEVRAEYDGKMQGVQFQIWDSTDRSEFRQLCREEPSVAKVREKVEAEYERLKAQGRPVSRELIANQEIAKLVRANAGRARTKQAKRADEGIRRETARPASTRSRVAPDRQRGDRADTPEARRKRLEGVIL